MKCMVVAGKTPKKLFRQSDLFTQMVVGYHYKKLPAEMRKISYNDLVLLEEFHKMYWFDSEKMDIRIQKLCQVIAHFSMSSTEKLQKKLGSMFGFKWLKWQEDHEKQLKKKAKGKTRPEGMSLDTFARHRKYNEVDGWFEIPGKNK